MIPITNKTARTVVAGRKAHTALELGALFLACALAACALASCGPPKAAAKEKEYPVAGVVVESPPHYDIMPRGSDFWISGAPGSVILYGDIVRNGVGGGLVLLRRDGTIRAGETAAFSLAKGEGGSPEVGLERGEVWLDLTAEQAAVRAPTSSVEASASTGEDARCVFGVYTGPAGPTTVTVVSGTAKVEAAGERTVVHEGEQVAFERGSGPANPVKVQVAVPTGGYDFLVGLQSAPYFRNAATRDQTAEDARAKTAASPVDPWPYVTLGRALCDAGSYAEAQAKFTKALELKPGFSQALAGQGRVAMAEGRWAEAFNLYKQAWSADKSSLEALLGMADASLGMGDLAEAEKRYKDTLEEDPASHLALTGLAIARVLRGALPEASADLEKALEASPAHAPAFQVQSYISALEGLLESSRASAGKAVESDGKDLIARAALADRYMRTGTDDAAKSSYKMLVDSEDASVMSDGYQGLGAIARESGDLEGAISNWSKAQDLSPDRPAVLEDLGLANLLAGRSEAAAAALAAATGADIGDWRAHAMLARAYVATSQLEKALAEAKLAVDLAPSQWSAHLVLGLVQEAASKGGGASELERALELKPSGGLPADAHVMLAEAYRRTGRHQEALKEYEAAEELSPSEGAYHRMAAETLTEMKREEEALAELKKAVELDPSDTLALVKLAGALYGSGKKDEAIKTLQDVVEKDPNDPQPRLILAEYLLDDKDTDGAIFQLDAAARAPGISPDVLASVLVARGNALDRKEDFPAAIDDYARAISSDPGRGDAWFYMAGDLERAGKAAEARNAYANAAALCKDRPEWKKFYDEASTRLNQL